MVPQRFPMVMLSLELPVRVVPHIWSFMFRNPLFHLIGDIEPFFYVTFL